MSELEQQPPQRDAISSLHRMSRTAGIATQEYVAVNNLAVVAAVLGAATALAFIAWLFLLLGVAGIIFGFIALRQIRNSNGTQTGRGLAILGIVLCLLLAGGVGIAAVLSQMAQREDQRAINAVVAEFGQAVARGDYPAAYQHLDRSFQARVNPEQFKQGWISLIDRLGKLETFEGNNAFVGFVPDSEGRINVSTMARIRFSGVGADGRVTLGFVKDSDGRWRIHSMDDVFPPPRAPKGSGTAG